MRVCKFRYNGLCCNSGSAFYEQECKNCEAQIPLTNGERFRAYLSEDDSLACFLSSFVTLLDAPQFVFEEVERGSLYIDAWKKWLKQPAEEAEQGG